MLCYRVGKGCGVKKLGGAGPWVDGAFICSGTAGNCLLESSLESESDHFTGAYDHAHCAHGVTAIVGCCPHVLHRLYREVYDSLGERASGPHCSTTVAGRRTVCACMLPSMRVGSSSAALWSQ